MDTKELAKRIRIHAVKMTHASHASHIASILSVADIIAVLYGGVMQIFPQDPNNDLRDRFILSKGHAGAAVYAALAEVGYFSVNELNHYCENGSNFSGHVSHKGVPGVELSTGALGHGACVACGMAFSAKLDEKDHHIYTVVGDGECEEGSIWEMALFASHHSLYNFTVIVDQNNFQALGTCQEVLGLTNLSEKWRNFGFLVVEIDGHNHHLLKEALQYRSPNQPVCVIAHTTKGKGVSFMENNLLWHYRDPQGEFYERAIHELEESYHEKSNN